MYPNYERDLKKELYLCHKNMGISMTELMNMPISDRKYYIKLHNRSVEEERARLQKGAGGK
jgi:hypothetical protein